MAKFNVVVPHEIERTEAVSRLRNFSEKIRNDMPVDVTDVQEDWDDSGNLSFSFKAMGFKISGQVTTGETDVKVAGNLPFAALPFRGAIESQIEEKLREAIDS